MPSRVFPKLGETMGNQCRYVPLLVEGTSVCSSARIFLKLSSMLKHTNLYSGSVAYPRLSLSRHYIEFAMLQVTFVETCFSFTLVIHWSFIPQARAKRDRVSMPSSVYLELKWLQNILISFQRNLIKQYYTNKTWKLTWHWKQPFEDVSPAMLV